MFYFTLSHSVCVCVCAYITQHMYQGDELLYQVGLEDSQMRLLDLI